jgi:hypothetical protein
MIDVADKPAISRTAIIVIALNPKDRLLIHRQGVDPVLI